MRLICPNCGAEYEPPRSMVPSGGRHVQCSACHTRWFARRDSRPMLTEEQILKRLESRKPNLRVVDEPVAAAWGEREGAEPKSAAAAIASRSVWSGPEIPEPEDEPAAGSFDFEPKEEAQDARAASRPGLGEAAAPAFERPQETAAKESAARETGAKPAPAAHPEAGPRARPEAGPEAGEAREGDGFDWETPSLMKSGTVPPGQEKASIQAAARRPVAPGTETGSETEPGFDWSEPPKGLRPAKNEIAARETAARKTAAREASAPLRPGTGSGSGSGTRTGTGTPEVRPAQAPPPPPAPAQTQAPKEAPAAGRRTFWMGFGLALGIGVLLVLAYLIARSISPETPVLGGAATGYAGLVDTVRLLIADVIAA